MKDLHSVFVSCWGQAALISFVNTCPLHLKVHKVIALLMMSPELATLRATHLKSPFMVLRCQLFNKNTAPNSSQGSLKQIQTQGSIKAIKIKRAGYRSKEILMRQDI